MNVSLSSSLVLALISASLWPGAAAAEQSASTTVAPQSMIRAGEKNESAPPGDLERSSQEGKAYKSSARLSPAAAQIIELIRAGAENSVIEAYIAQVEIAEPLRVCDLLALKKAGVSDEITVSLLKRAAVTLAAREQESKTLPSDTVRSQLPPRVTVRPSPQVLDPESYEFWWYHYAYPRALASANDRLLSSYRYFQGPLGQYGYYPPLPLSPRYPGLRFAPR